MCAPRRRPDPVRNLVGLRAELDDGIFAGAFLTNDHQVIAFVQVPVAQWRTGQRGRDYLAGLRRAVSVHDQDGMRAIGAAVAASELGSRSWQHRPFGANTQRKWERPDTAVILQGYSRIITAADAGERGGRPGLAYAKGREDHFNDRGTGPHEAVRRENRRRRADVRR